MHLLQVETQTPLSRKKLNKKPPRIQITVQGTLHTGTSLLSRETERNSKKKETENG